MGDKYGKSCKSRLFFDKTTCFCWSEMGDSNSRHLAPKPMSELSARGLAPSLALSGTPAVPF